MLGLGPSDTNDELRYDGNPANNSAVPIMYPATPAGPTVLGGGTDPTLDDKMSVTELYPATTADTNTGWIQGTLTAADGKTGLQGIGPQPGPCSQHGRDSLPLVPSPFQGPEAQPAVQDGPKAG